MGSQIIFIPEKLVIDLSFLGNQDQVKVMLSGADFKLVSPSGEVIIVYGRGIQAYRKSH